jgi:hypothetical protein
MAEPPAVVVHSSRPQGDLQLHRLIERVSFHCVRCQKEKTADLVATISDNWAQKVCEQCYGSLVYEQRKPAREAAKAKKAKREAANREAANREEAWRAELAKQQAANREALKVESTKPNTTRQEARKAARARAQMPGASGLLEFLRAADVSAELVDGRLWINGEQIQRGGQLPRPDTFGWRKEVDKIVVEHIRDKFSAAVEENAHFGNGIQVVPQWGESGFSIMRGGAKLAIIHPTRAYISDGKDIHAKVIHENFVTAGPHWEQVANVLRDVEAEVAAGLKRDQQATAANATGWRRIDQLPDYLGPELIKACLDASRRIRLERRLDYGDTPAVLECDGHKLILLPIARSRGRLLVPFRLSKGTETLTGELILGDRDPLPVLIGEDVAYEDAITAWTWALLGFADATCIELDPAEPTARRELARPRRHPRSPASQPRPPAPALPGKPRWPSYLEPVGHTIRYVNSLVRGHRRRLSGRQTASDAQRDLARRIGIKLRPNETWVQPHARGWPADAELRFVWHAPTELELFNA